MELLYVWIERFNNIRNQEFCFTTEYDIKFYPELKTLSIETKEKISARLFDEAFLNVTAIIGKNGSGKTSFLYFIKHLFTTNEIRLSDPFLLVLKDNKDKIFTISKVKITENIKITQLDLTAGIRKLNESIALIFHSNTFSAYYQEIDNMKYIDVSLNASIKDSSITAGEKLLDSYDDFIYFQKDNPKDVKFMLVRDYLIRSHIPQLYFQQQEIKSNLDFISNYHGKQWSFIPKSFDVGFNPIFFMENLDYFSSIGSDNPLRKKISNQIFKKANEIYDDKNEDIKLFKQNVIIYLFLSYLSSNNFGTGGKETKIQSFIDELKDADENSISDKIYDFIIDYPTTNYNILLESIKQFIRNIDKKFDSFSNFQKLYNGQYSFRITGNLLNTINELFNIWHPNEFIFSLDWRGLSAGESALLNIFSRINSLITTRYVGKTVWLLIDEGDLYLHPEWQRTLFNDLHNYLPKFFKNKKIQLVLTSHTPFLVSDLPKENIVLLNKESETGKCVVVKTEALKNTFAANIHSLYSDAFFMEGGLMGEFAKQKIEDLIRYFNKEKTYEVWTNEKAKCVIDIIGEPVLKEHLENLWLKENNPEYANKSREELINLIKELESKTAQQNETD